MMKRILRHTVTIDDQPHEIPFWPIVMFGRTDRNRLPGMERLVDVWVETPTPDDWPASEYRSSTRMVQVVGTGQAVPDKWTHLASFIDGGLVWHLYEVRA